eukprot:TRINITY_DN8411_c0_g1_i1.p1 TRINITY_DN8411_c0_g1~~TRINITY_DN8411_c0_g1_i1.p1  ORF type:complete len:451 (+),score=83.71 TRINITY_DN8411_c0_g1_i1:64-1416(+)
MQFPSNVGILAMDIYFPKQSVLQSQLEVYNGVADGKYTIGLGQNAMNFVGDREDVVSMSLSVVRSFFEKYAVSPMSIGRLEVGTESMVDKSKSIKSFIMNYFSECGNHDIEGVDNINACYGGTNSLFNAINWVESRSWDGRYALVIAADVAVYDKGPARPTGGAAAVAMLIGANAPIVFDSGLKSSYFAHAYDFYKPNPRSEYPTVDGKLSIECYLAAIDACYKGYSQKYETVNNVPFSLNETNFVIFHSPYNKLVKKGIGRMMLNDFLRNPDDAQYDSEMDKWRNICLDNSFHNKELERDFLKFSSDLYNEKVQPGVLLSKELGNMYCASIFASLISLVHNQRDNLIGKQILLFSYGSGLTSSIFSMRVVSSIDYIAQRTDIENALSSRIFFHPRIFNEKLELKQRRYMEKNYIPTDDLSLVENGRFYLDFVDEERRRFYKCVGVKGML